MRNPCKKYLLFRTYRKDESAKDRFEFMARSMSSFVHLVWLHDGDIEGSSYSGPLPENCSQFSTTDAGIRKLWPLLFESYDSCTDILPRMFRPDGSRYPIKWCMSHLSILEWWIACKRPMGRFITMEDDIWWDRDWDPMRAFEKAFKRDEFLAPMVKTYMHGRDPTQPISRNTPKWYRDCMVCHDFITARSDRLMMVLEQVSNSGAWGQGEVIVPSAAKTHPEGRGCSQWSLRAFDENLCALIHRFEGQKQGKSPQRIFFRRR